MIRALLKKHIEIAARKQFGDILIPSYTLEPPENQEYGDYATNIALVLAKTFSAEDRKKNPMEIASAIVNQLPVTAYRASVAPPGFINFALSQKILEQELKEVLRQKNKYGANKKKREKIQVEFISANPTGPLTLANGRGGFLGDVLSRVLEHQGYRVEREYYVNDTGKQIITLGLSMAASAGLAETGENYYRGPHIDAWSKTNKAFIRKNLGNPEQIGRRVAADFLKRFIKPAVEKRMSIRFQKWTSESGVMKRYAKKIENLARAKNLVYEKEGATWLRTMQLGDDKDRVIKTSDGFPTYFFNDAAHYLETKARGFSGKINFLGADHHGYVPRIQAVAQIVGLKNSDIVVFQLVRLISGGQEVRMSKRRGVFITIDELIEDVGRDVARYFFLEKSPSTHIDFDLDLAKEKTLKNPVYYIQYAHARLSSILRKARKANYLHGARLPPRARLAPESGANGGKLQIVNYKLLKEKEEYELIKKLIRFPEIVENTANDYQVQRLPKYTLELARSFNHFYERQRVISGDPALTRARLALVLASQIVLKNMLNLLGIASPEKM